MFITEFDLNHYQYNYLPPQVIDESISIIGNNEITINLIDNIYIRVISFYRLTQRYRNPNLYNKIYNEYTFKDDLSVIYLFPVLYLQALNIDATKKESFQMLLEHNEYFKELSKLRVFWKTSFMSKLFISFKYSFFVRYCYLRFLIKPLKSNSVLIDGKFNKKSVSELNDVLNGMSQKILKHYKNE
jgi:hypothetical protein